MIGTVDFRHDGLPSQDSVPQVARPMPRLPSSLRLRLAGLLVTTALGLVQTSAGWAQDAATAPAAAVSFDIPAGGLAGAAAAWERASGFRLVAESSLLAGRLSGGVTGAHAPREALTLLLAGTGLVHRFTDAETAAIVPASWSAVPGTESGVVALDQLSVIGSGTGAESAYGPVRGFVASRSATASKTDASIIETPQSISVVTRDQIEEQGATTVSEALRYSSGIVTGTAGLQSRRFDPVFVRGFGGFSADASYVSYLDGLRWNFPARTAVQFDPYLLERVEVFKGPSSVLYGRAQPGGFVNLVTKKPTDVPVREVFTRVGSRGYVESGVDVGGRLDDEGTFLYRMVALGRDARTQVDYQEEQRVLLAPSLTWRPSAQTSLTLQGVYQRDPSTSDAGFVSPRGTILGIPGGGRVRETFFQGDRSWNRFARTEAWIGAQFEHRFDEALTFRSNLRYGELTDTFKSVDFSALAANGRTLSRFATISRHQIANLSLDNQLEAKFSTGPLAHTALVGVDYQWMDGPWDYGFSAAPTIDILAPNNSQPFVKPRPLVHFGNRIEQTGVYAQDQIAFGNWRLWLSGRHDWSQIGTSRTMIATGTLLSNAEAADKAFTGRAGLVYLFENGLAPYASYATSFEPSLSNVSGRSAYPPTTGEQWEVGLKYQPPGYNAFITFAAFDLVKNNVATVSPTFDVTVDGQIRSRGFEMEAKASLSEGLNLIASYTYIDMEVTKSSETTVLIDGSGSISNQGKVPVAVPRHTAALWADNAFLPSSPLYGFAIGGGIRYISSTYGTASNVWNEPGYVTRRSKVPGFLLGDAAITYDFGKRDPRLLGLSLTVNVKNLFDKEYIAACNGFGSCSFGEGRTVLATARYRW